MLAMAMTGGGGGFPRGTSGGLVTQGASSSLTGDHRLCPTCGARYPRDAETCSADGAALLDADELVGTTLADTYVVERIIGEGGMGRVYQARHTRIGAKLFAVKTLHPEYARQPEILARFQREAEAAAAINSEYVLGVYDVDRTQDGRPFMVAEFLEGAELGAYLDAQGKLEPAFAVRVVRQVCKALAAAHAIGVVHRDVKPENVFLTGEAGAPVAKVIDFGISRLDDKAGGNLTRTGMILGTPAYMAPEQARGDRVDHRADIYAVGGILYRALTGRLPFDRDDPSATVVAVLTEEPMAPRSIEPRIPEALELVIQTAMAKNPDSRYQHIEDLDAALAPFDAMSAATATAPQPGAPARPTMGTAATLQASELRNARPFVVALITTAAMSLLFGLAGLMGAVVRVIKGGGATSALTGAESILAFFAVLAALGTPAILAIRHLRRHVWRNSQKVLELLRRTRGPVLVTLASYGVAALVSRTLDLGVLRRPGALSWAGWDIVLFALGATAALVALAWPRLEARRASGSGGTLLAILLTSGTAVVVAAAVAAGPGGGAIGLANDGGVADGGPAPSGTSAGGTGGTGRTAAPGTTVVPPVLTGDAQQLWQTLEDQLKTGRLKDGVATIDALLAAEPRAYERSEVRNAARDVFMEVALVHLPEQERMIAIITQRMGTAGADILYELVTTRGGSRGSKVATTTLEDPRVRERGSPAMRVAYDVRNAACKDKPGLFDRAAAEGDSRVLGDLKLLEHCSRRAPCCLTGDAALKAATAALDQRLR